MLTRYPPGLASALRKVAGDTTPMKTANNATAHLWLNQPSRTPGEEPVYHFRCPGCRRRLRYRRAQEGHAGKCSHCGHGVIFPTEGVALADGKPTVGAMPEIDEIVAQLAAFLRPAAPEVSVTGFSFPELERTPVEARVS